ncbi:ferredoxin--NADP+ reductase [Rhodococcus sp. OK611]|jgi:ferredoxin/flavodoxin---NADP+ reductase|uniref:FAD-dependent oxidoreductase n=1 Tax=unclassified Rhodococcus (in: high G+C Gram-positive bacteria) TaxID=192944 RepID=UPI000BDA87DC|nr:MULTISPECIES: FAD-dependent oxidoreductase [unclassified Rhodococcus (in: high G+C Gram-positive bacteria)]PTR36927.1 ferredoxin--NADP+ reductase [Rhodococcus sp. OK611]SNX93658.1 ferredoxin--NADP+ reductase [Rhodococcus sp. OK270]
MPHVVTQSCCSDASCVYACPVNCIHPTPDEPDFLTAEMLHIDPASCVDCGACISACPVDAIVPHSKLTESQQPFLTINADFYKEPRPRPVLAPVVPAPEVRRDRGPLRVAIVGAGPAAMYAADELLTQPGVQVNVFDRLPVPHGLVRAGVAPDHQKTKQVSRLYDKIAAQPGFEYFLNVEIGEHLTHDELLAHHHAVIYAVGASTDRGLEIPGEDLPGSTSATNLVAWYNGHPDHADDRFDLSHRRAVIIGNGNVALDVARILTADPDRLAATDIAPTALEALRGSRIEEVVIVARRGIAQSAFTVPEFTGLLDAPAADVVVRPDEMVLDPITERLASDGELSHAVAQKLALLRSARREGEPGQDRRRISLRYLLSPTAISGDDRVTGVEFARNALTVGEDGSVRVEPTGETERLEAGLLLTSIGYRGVPIAGVPFDHSAGVIPNTDGRVLDGPGGSVLAGAYATGWIKRGPTGFIGTNKSCAQETVTRLVDDFNSGRLREPRSNATALNRLVRERQSAVIDREGWKLIDEAERSRGTERGRIREKITDQAELALIAGAAGRGTETSVLGRLRRRR